MLSRSVGQSQYVGGWEKEGVWRCLRRSLRELFLNISHGFIVIQPILNREGELFKEGPTGWTLEMGGGIGAERGLDDGVEQQSCNRLAPALAFPFLMALGWLGKELATRRGRGHPKEKKPKWEGEARVWTWTRTRKNENFHSYLHYSCWIDSGECH
jgi:hypothetical protein